ncbi:PaaX family transcriptional regulator C-terminal domain-containing protein [Blastococcus brunescens]|uniref:PaaX family transcriptional regulator C-terminal domain-containing protein n=1 Tax=Blastococcus brunescens TaxID=1564165 RepID=A0ABZ1BAY9_9ACTN|nr:PaaX family transcriptional regulator C-terminal domain-containing protein [Blastococcus sp. BMG 8361]WRL66769.1 PaaX family transcriptional regulator C-terminal domain-containing protein [Blastococcus sp. BMG 8361]
MATPVLADEAGFLAPDPGLRPESLLLTFFGVHVLGRPVMVASTGVLDVMARVGVSPHATRSALTRMVKKGLLVNHRRGRPVYFGLTPRSEEVLADGGVRIWRSGAVNRHWDGRWTLLSFSLPESWQRQRQELRSRLLWAGFGPLQGGLWVAPAAVDVARLLDGLEAAQHVRAFLASPAGGTDVAAMAADAWDLPQLAGHYETFIERWDGGVADRAYADPLGRQLALQAEWLRAIRADPRLPVGLLPAPWPAERAQELFHRLHAEVEVQARATAAQLLDTIPVPVR